MKKLIAIILMLVLLPTICSAEMYIQFANVKSVEPEYRQMFITLQTETELSEREYLDPDAGKYSEGRKKSMKLFSRLSMRYSGGMANEKKRTRGYTLCGRCYVLILLHSYVNVKTHL